MYTIMGAFPELRRRMNSEFKRVGFNGIKEKRWFFVRVLGHSPAMTEMTISEMNQVIGELNKYENVSDIK